MELTKTQKDFIDYMNGEMASKNQIIVYNRSGHFGLGEALRYNFPNAEVMMLSILKKKKEYKGILNRIGSITSFFIANFSFHANNSITSSVTVDGKKLKEDFINKYYNISEDYSYLRYLKIKRNATAKTKTKYILRCDQESLTDKEDIEALKYIHLLIINKRIYNTVMVFSVENYKKIVNELHSNDKFPTFYLKKEDLKTIASQLNIKIEDENSIKEKLISCLGIDFFIKNYEFFNNLILTKARKEDELYVMMNDLYEFLLDKSDLKTRDKELTSLLEFASFFNNVFSALNIKSFGSKEFDIEDLNSLCKIAVLNALKKENNLSDYAFSEEVFKMHFYNRYTQDLFVNPKLVFEYFISNRPFEYLAILKVLKIDSSYIKYQEKQSYIMIGYYFCVENYLDYDVDFFKKCTNSDSLVSMVLSIYIKFKNKDHSLEYAELFNAAIVRLKGNDELNSIGLCAALCLILQILKEDYVYLYNHNFYEMLSILSNEIDKINTDTLYEKYWSLYFMEQLIALSLEDELCEMTIIQRRYNFIEKEINGELLSYIKLHDLRDFKRLALLSHSMDIAEAESILQNLFYAQKKECLFKEIVRINYSSCLIEHSKYEEAYKLLNVGFSQEYLKAINLDSYHAYINNFSISKYLSAKIDLSSFTNELKSMGLEGDDNNDDLIIKNNYYTACLTSKDKDISSFGYSGLKKIQEGKNKYNSFYALHNLLMYCFLNDMYDKYIELISYLDVPILLKNDSTFFIDKFEKMKNNWENKKIIDEKGLTRFEHYNSSYLFGVVERWFE